MILSSCPLLYHIMWYTEFQSLYGYAEVPQVVHDMTGVDR